MKTPEQLMELAERIFDEAPQGTESIVPYVAATLAQIQRETAEECARLCCTDSLGGLTGVGAAEEIRHKFGINLCTRCGKPKGIAEGCCGCGR